MKQNSKENVLVIRHVFKRFFKEGDFQDYNQFIAEDISVHCPKSWQEIHSPEPSGRENLKKIDQDYAQAFQFRDVDIGDITAFEDKVFVRWASRGIHRGAFCGVSATNLPFSVSGQTLYRLNTEGMVAEVWQSWDMLGLLNQIGWQQSDAVSIAPKDIDILLKKSARLSARERDCLKLLVRGKTAKDTAAELFVSSRTVEYYFENIKDKLGCSSKRELFSIARLMEMRKIL